MHINFSLLSSGDHEDGRSLAVAGRKVVIASLDDDDNNKVNQENLPGGQDLEGLNCHERKKVLRGSDLKIWG